MNYPAIFLPAAYLIVASPVFCYMVQPDGYEYHKVAIVAGFVWSAVMAVWACLDDEERRWVASEIIAAMGVAAMVAQFVLPIIALIHGLA